MDLGFARLVAADAEPAPPPLEYTHLVAALAAAQASSRTAAVETWLVAGRAAPATPLAALVDLLTAAPGWRRAAAVLEGSFHPAIAAGNPRFPP